MTTLTQLLAMTKAQQKTWATEHGFHHELVDNQLGLLTQQQQQQQIRDDFSKHFQANMRKSVEAMSDLLLKMIGGELTETETLQLREVVVSTLTDATKTVIQNFENYLTIDEMKSIVQFHSDTTLNTKIEMIQQKSQQELENYCQSPEFEAKITSELEVLGL